MVNGVGPDAPTITNDQGAKQSDSPYLWTEFSPDALLRLAQISSEGNKKYGPKNYMKISHNEHINHAITHLFAALAGDTQDDHLGHAACRILFAMAVEHDGP